MFPTHARAKSVNLTEQRISNIPCLCAPSGVFCVAYDGDFDIINIWEYLIGGQPTEDPGFIEAMGFTGMTDEVAIVTKAKENIIFAMATLSMKDRQRLSTTKRELVHKCSFNGIACDIDKYRQYIRYLKQYNKQRTGSTVLSLWFDVSKLSDA
ncbi:unnamed protein product [Gongylonema pulchrum]|uniref:BTB/POZ domain-containing protein n=1 Tax=Gongylonema pulchrum TaxID=637853 RepID=A0A183DQJ3_9BILA|nr:unnamed protein product [Gongylonema pulchrum]